MRRYLSAALMVLATNASAQWPPLVDLSNTSAPVTFTGAAAWDKTGSGFACGDFDGDNLVDVALLSEGQLGSSGFAFFHVFWGTSPLPSIVDLASYGGDYSFVRAITKEVGTWARLAAGDYDGDGIDDIALGIPCRDPFANCDGKVYVIFGSPDFPSTLDLGNPSIEVASVLGIPGSDGTLGIMLATGDINADLKDDLVMAAPNVGPGGEVYILWGQSVMPSTIELGGTAPEVTRLVDPRNAFSSGDGLACGDVNHDGFADVLVGAPGGDEVMLLLGAAALPATMMLNSPPIKRCLGAGDGIGWRVRLDDYNGDDHADMIMSALYASPLGCEECGEVLVVYGSDSLPDSVSVSSPTAPISRLFGEGVTQSYGQELSSGDVNGDGYSDIVISSGPDDIDQSTVSKVTVAHGSATPADTVYLGSDPTVIRFLAETRPDDFGKGLLCADINGDNVADLLMGATHANVPGRTAAGKAYVFYGESAATGVVTRKTGTVHLFQNYPNPFNPVTTIDIEVSGSADVTLRIYDVQGSLVKHLFNGPLSSGTHQLRWNGTNDRGEAVASGVYFYRIVGSLLAETRKMILLK